MLRRVAERAWRLGATVAVAARALSLLLAVLLVVAVVHKAKVLAVGVPQDEPLTRARRWSGTRARLALILAVAAELVAVAALIFVPRFGFGVVTGLLLLYVLELRRLSPYEDCACFGDVLPRARRDQAMARNILLALFSIGAGVGYWTRGIAVAAIDQQTVGVALVAAALVFAPAALAGALRRGRSPRSFQPQPRELRRW